MSESPKRQHIGIYGGTFDPVHVAHLLIAEQARESFSLDQVIWIPASRAPHKLDQLSIDAKHRLEMVRLAINGNDAFTADDREIARGGTSFTVDTLEELKKEHPDARLYFLMGADSVNDLHTWRNPKRICELAFIVVVARGGTEPPNMANLQQYLPDEDVDLNAHLLQMPEVEISSTNIRERLRGGRSIRYQVPAAVAAYISAHRLYRAMETPQ